MSEQPIGIIHEVGDLGLGFDPVGEKDQKTIQESFKEKEQEKKEEKK